MSAVCGSLSTLVFLVYVSDLAIPMKISTLCVSTAESCSVYVSLLPDGQPLTLSEEVQNIYVCLSAVVWPPLGMNNISVLHWLQLFSSIHSKVDCVCVRLLIDLQCVFVCVYIRHVCVDRGAFRYPEVSSRRQVLHPPADI